MLQGKKRNNESKSFPKQKETYFFCSHYFAICGDRGKRAKIAAITVSPPTPVPSSSAPSINLPHSHSQPLLSPEKKKPQQRRANEQTNPFLKIMRGGGGSCCVVQKVKRRAMVEKASFPFLLFEIAMCEKEEKRNESWVLCEENPGGLILKRPPPPRGFFLAASFPLLLFPTHKNLFKNRF